MARGHRLPHRFPATTLVLLVLVAACFADLRQALGADTWRGLAVAPEYRCGLCCKVRLVGDVSA